jgi:hypothetical protein
MIKKTIKTIREFWSERLLYSGIFDLVNALTIQDKNVFKGEYLYDYGNSIWEVTIKKIK